MDTATVYELIGYAGSALVVLSLMMRSLLRLRIVNLVGAAVFTVYGVLIAAPPVWLVNLAIVFIDVWYLRQMLGDDEQVEVLEVDPDDAYLQRFLERYRDDIATFVPAFSGVGSDHRAYFVLRDLVPAALVVLRRTAPDEAVVELDYAPPEYRDHTSGRYVYGDGALFDELGIERLTAAAGEPRHDRYLEKMGFDRRGDHYELDLAR